jgi:hypothetical protein
MIIGRNRWYIVSSRWIYHLPQIKWNEFFFWCEIFECFDCTAQRWLFTEIREFKLSVILNFWSNFFFKFKFYHPFGSPAVHCDAVETNLYNFVLRNMKCRNLRGNPMQIPNFEGFVHSLLSKYGIRIFPKSCWRFPKNLQPYLPGKSDKHNWQPQLSVNRLSKI